jgi:hypothetical protein
MKWFCVALFCAVGLIQGQPPLANAKLETRPLRGSLAQEVAAIEGPAWLAYTVAAVPSRWASCWNEGNSNLQQRERKVMLEGFKEFHVFIRVDARRVNRIRYFSPDCEVDAGGLPVYFLTNVAQAQSVAFLKAERKVDAIGPHAGPEADAALEEFVTAMYPDKIRTQAAFWLGSSRKQRGVDILVKLLREDPSERFRQELLFPLSRSAEGIAVLLDLARRKGSDAKLREKAMFWLARSEDPRAAKFVEEILSR